MCGYRPIQSKSPVTLMLSKSEPGKYLCMSSKADAQAAGSGGRARLRRTGRKTAWLTSAATRAARAQCAPSRALTAKATSVVRSPHLQMYSECVCMLQPPHHLDLQQLAHAQMPSMLCKPLPAFNCRTPENARKILKSAGQKPAKACNRVLWLRYMSVSEGRLCPATYSLNRTKTELQSWLSIL